MLTFDHIVIAAETLEAGVAHVREKLGVDIPYGGKHPLMGTHNHVMQLGSEAFLEVIAIDPEAETPRNRWFWLDSFSGAPRIWHWVARVNRMADAGALSVDVGRPVDLTRGDLYWQLTVRDDGSMPFDGAFPSIIDWPDGIFPVPRMADLGCRLERLTLGHPQAGALRDALGSHFSDGRVDVVQSEQVALSARIITPSGPREL